jgi:cell division protein FtsB
MRELSSYLSRSGRRVATGAAVVIAGLLGYHAVFGANGISAYQQKKHQHQVLQAEIEQLKKENTRLQDRVQHLQSDPEAIKHEARTLLHFTEPTEVIYAMPAAPATPGK